MPPQCSTMQRRYEFYELFKSKSEVVAKFYNALCTQTDSRVNICVWERTPDINALAGKSSCSFKVNLIKLNLIFFTDNNNNWRQGYQLAGDLRSCLDIDECNVSTKFHCSQLCENTVPGYLCICSQGYELLPNGHHCKAIDKQPMRLLYANRIDIRWALPPDQLNYYQTYLEEYRKAQLQRITSTPSSTNSHRAITNKKAMHLPPLTDEQQNELSEMWFQPLLFYNMSSPTTAGEQQQFQSSPTSSSPTVHSQILLNNLQNAVSIDFHWTTGRLYWADITQDAIYTMHINGSAIDGSQLIRPIVQAGLVSPSGLCVDWVNGFIIWTDSGTSRIELCDLDGDNRHVLLHREVRRPRDIVVFPEKS